LPFGAGFLILASGAEERWRRILGEVAEWLKATVC
jgi:hypothetical protein